jgi:WD40 repeat protein
MTEESLFLAALDRPDPDDRRRFLDGACANDPDLRKRIDGLLAAYAAGRDKLEPPTAGPSPTVDYRPGAEPGIVVAGRYRLLERIGEGGMGEVWVARQIEPVQRKVALKLIKAGMDSKSVLTRFEAERQALAMMDHPNIAKVLDGGLTADGRPFFAMELVNGQPLTRFCDEAKLTPRQRLELFVPVCQAVHHAHQKGIVHRDLKPSNILVTLYDGRPVPKVIDFGVAKATGGRLTEETLSTQFGAVVGTFEYMAPEQAGFSALDVDTRADVYSLGVILYELLTGLRPFDGPRLRKAAIDELFRILREEDPPKPSTKLSTDASLPSAAAVRGTDPRKLTALMKGELDWIVMKCLEKDRSRRYESASGLARDVQRYLADEVVEARPPSARYRARKFVRRNRGRVVGAALVLLALVAGVAGTTAGLIEARGQRDAARDAREQADADRLTALAEFKRAEQEAGRARVAEVEQGKARREAEAALVRSDGLRLGSLAAVARPTDPGLALLLGLEAVRRYPHHLTYGPLYDAAADLYERRTLRPGLFNMEGVRLSPDGKRALVYSASQTEGSLAVIDVATGKRLAAWGSISRGTADADWSPDGSRAVAVADGRSTVVFTDGQKPDRATFTDRVAYVWDPATGRDLVHLRRHDDRVVSARFSPDGTKVVTASWDATARIWDAARGRELHVLRGHTNSLLGAWFTPDGRRVLTVCAQQDQTAFNRDPVTGRVPPDGTPNTDPGPTTRPFRVEGGAGGRSSGSPRTPDPAFARLWDVETGQQVGKLALDARWRFGQPPLPLVVAFSPDGQRVAVGFNYDLIGVWDVAGGPPVHVFDEPLPSVFALAFSPDRALLAAAGANGSIVLWDLRTGKRDRQLAGYGSTTVNDVRFSPDGRRLVAAGADHTARVWQVRTGQPVAVFHGHDGAVKAASFLDADTVLTAGDDTVRVWSAAAAPPMALALSEPDPPGGRLGKWFGTPPARHRGSVTALAFAPDGQSVFTGSNDHTVRRWDAATGRQLAQLPAPLRGDVRGLVVGPGGVVYVGTELSSAFPEPDPDRQTHLSMVHRWDPGTGRAARFLKGQNAAVTSLDLSADGRRLLLLRGQNELDFGPDSGRPTNLRYGSSGKPVPLVTVWDTATGERLWASLPAEDFHERLRPRFSPDGQAVVYRTDRPDELGLFDARTGARVRTLAVPQRTHQAMTPQGLRGPQWDKARFTPDGRVVVAQAGSEPVVWFWDAGTGELLGAFRFPDGTSVWEARMEFSPDSRRLAVTSGRTVQLIDVATRTGTHVLHGHEANVTALAFAPDGTRLLTGSEDKTAALWDVESGRLVTVYRGHPATVHLVAYSPDGTRVATASPMETFARVWPVDLVPEFERRKPRELTAAERVRYELPPPGRRE